MWRRVLCGGVRRREEACLVRRREEVGLVRRREDVCLVRRREEACLVRRRGIFFYFTFFRCVVCMWSSSFGICIPFPILQSNVGVS